jgi:hypothetical protein
MGLLPFFGQDCSSPKLLLLYELAFLITLIMHLILKSTDRGRAAVGSGSLGEPLQARQKVWGPGTVTSQMQVARNA